MEKRLLHTPEGVRDIYGNELRKKQKVENDLMTAFDSFGYKRIQTPVFEFFDVFSKEIGTTKSNELYKFFDKEGNTLVLRPDFTPSMARCAAKYYLEEDIPVRFCYCGNTFTNTSELQGKLKEVTQTGVELIGDGARSADAELIHLAVTALKKSGLKEFQISIGEIEFFKGLCEEAGLSEEMEEQVRRLISNKNYFGVEEYITEEGIEKSKADAFLKVAELFGSYDCLEEAKTLVTNEKSLKAVKRLEKLYDTLKEFGDEKYVSFDLGMVSKYNYYTGIIFKAYTYGVGDAILKGGRYDNLLSYFGKSAPAIGFMIVVDDLMIALGSQKLTPESTSDIEYLLYDKSMYKEAVKIADKRRSLGCKVECVAFAEGKQTEDYVRYGYNHMVSKLYRLTSDEKVLVYDLADDSADALPVDNYDLKAFLGREE
ncbi:MAG: ATP phosphoribosyltransferase regulatory subunit [Lachnospiraceae bacterium]|nr:ATP phosphoribosyltransferase regulatory subunit [Lachnospiraceae bacterium]